MGESYITALCFQIENLAGNKYGKKLWNMTVIDLESLLDQERELAKERTWEQLIKTRMSQLDQATKNDLSDETYTVCCRFAFNILNDIIKEKKNEKNRD